MSSDDRNKTVFRPSPLKKSGGSKPSDAAPSTPQAQTDSWDAPVPKQSPGETFKPMESPPTPQRAFTAAEKSDTVPAPAQPRKDRNPLLAHSAPVLAMIAAVQSGRWQPSLQELHSSAKATIAEFEAAIDPIYPESVRQRAKYAVCATVDDVAQNLPGIGWGASQWAQRNMVVTFFKESIGGDRFFVFVKEMLRDPAGNRDLIELFHTCLAVGFEGRNRALPDGRGRNQEVMVTLYNALKDVREISQTEIVSHWKGEDAPRKPVNFWGLIALCAGVATAACFFIYLTLFGLLMGNGNVPSKTVAGLMPDVPVTLTRYAPVLEVPETTREVRLKEFLKNEIEVGLVTVEGNRVITGIGALFAPASDQLLDGRQAIFERIGAAGELESGTITVEGHTDSDPISTYRYPNNMALAEARARTVANIIRRQLSDPSRVEVIGVGDTVPLASNSTADGKARNRRVEVLFDYDLLQAE